MKCCQYIQQQHNHFLRVEGKPIANKHLEALIPRIECNKDDQNFNFFHVFVFLRKNIKLILTILRNSYFIAKYSYQE